MKGKGKRYGKKETVNLTAIYRDIFLLFSFVCSFQPLSALHLIYGGIKAGNHFLNRRQSRVLRYGALSHLELEKLKRHLP